ncbi:MAG: polysaccharide deacetylase family protein, partial [Gloeobacteraceae cyanobacterium ES-bin-144]|nr:polysaccharide deacetylase family protein [Verrucomicrobiales bacterium]
MPPIPAGSAPVKTTANPNYRTPLVGGSVPRNPDNNFSSNFPSSPTVSYSRVLVSGNYIAMTFDDGPHPQNTPRLLDILRARNIKATFYVIGQSVNLYPQIVRRTVAEGHEMGNHTQTHRLLSKMGNSEVKLELQRCSDAVANAAGVKMRTMRPPYGGLLQHQREMVYSEFGYP